MGGRSHTSKLHPLPDVTDHRKTQPIYINAPQPSHVQDCASSCCWLSFIFMTSTVYHHLRFVFPRLAHISTPIHRLHVHTHGLGVHKAASGACWCRFQSEGPKRGTALLLDRCKYPHTRWCCTSGIGNPPLRISGLRCAVWGSGRSERTGIFYSRLCFTSETLIIHIFQSFLETAPLSGVTQYLKLIFVFIHAVVKSFLRWIVTAACAKLYSSTTGARTLAKLAPCTPVSILPHEVGGQPDAVTSIAMLQQAKHISSQLVMLYNKIHFLCLPVALHYTLLY